MKSVFRKNICASLVAAALILGSVTAFAVPAASAATPTNNAKTVVLPEDCGIGMCCTTGMCVIGICCHFKN